MQRRGDDTYFLHSVSFLTNFLRSSLDFKYMINGLLLTSMPSLLNFLFVFIFLDHDIRILCFIENNTVSQMQPQTDDCIDDLKHLIYFLILPMTLTLMLWDFSLVDSDPLLCLMVQV